MTEQTIPTAAMRVRLPVGVAPMEGITTFPTRLWLHLTSTPTHATTPFLRVTKTFPLDALPESFAPELGVLNSALPYVVTPQLMACDPDQFLRAVELFPKSVFPIIELNCGCPTPNGAGRLAGSGILRDAHEFGATIARLCQALGAGRLAVKMRVGMHESDEFEPLLHEVQSLPLARLTVHGRTRAEKYRGRSRSELIERAARATIVPTWASGDVLGLKSLGELARVAPSIAGAMIGRGLMHNPWVFAEIARGSILKVDMPTLVHALASFGMLHELWIRDATKLVARVASGRIGEPCLVDGTAWERLTTQLMTLLGAPPAALRHAALVPELPVSPTAFTRVRTLFAHLRTSLPEELAPLRLVRSRSMSELCRGLLAMDPGESFEISAEREYPGRPIH